MDSIKSATLKDVVRYFCSSKTANTPQDYFRSREYECLRGISRFYKLRDLQGYFMYFDLCKFSLGADGEFQFFEACLWICTCLIEPIIPFSISISTDAFARRLIFMKCLSVHLWGGHSAAGVRRLVGFLHVLSQPLSIYSRY